MKSLRIAAVGLLMALALFQLLATASRTDTKPAAPLDDSALSSAICPIVYPLDESPSDRGYHYIFYGNAFFINDQGYLLTAAHVLSQLNGAPPYILLRLPMAPPRLLRATLVAIDRDHDVALLQATPNPFHTKYQVRFLPLLLESPALAQAVEAAALRPSRLKDPHSFDAFTVDRPAGEVLGYEFSSPGKSHADTELFLFGHEVLLGDSGAPVVSTQSQAVVGLVEGRWLRPHAAATSATAPAHQPSGIAAAVSIHYAIALLQQQGVAWHSAPSDPNAPAASAAAAPAQDCPTPLPLSLVAAPYPSQTLLGGEVALDALVDRNGQLADIRVVRGAPPFLHKALSAVRTWSFLPARANGEAVESRVGIAFQFASPPGSPRNKAPQPSSETSSKDSFDAADHGPVPSFLTDPQSPVISGSETSVILSAQIDPQGHPASIQLIRGGDSLAPSIASALSQWQFTPAKQVGTNISSTFIAVQIFRPGATPSHAKSTASSRTLVQ